MPRRLRDQVVVITGASSGIGRAAARAFAEQGAAVVLAARRERPLRDAEEECLNLGGAALVVPTDVTREDQMQELAERAVERFGRIDTWFNNAGVGLYGRFEGIPLEAFRRLIDTNLFGAVHGARAALPLFRCQGHGVLINNASVLALAAQPYASPYIVSKYAVRGLSEALRAELTDEPDIHVCTIYPAVIDTPFFQHAANFAGRAVQAMAPVHAPEQVADTVLRLAVRPRPDTVVGIEGRLLAWQHAMAPELSDRLVARIAEQRQFQDRKQPATLGSLVEPMEMGTGASGGWRYFKRRRSRRPAVMTALALLTLPTVGVLAWRQLGRPSS